VIYAKEHHKLSTRAVCNSLSLSRSSYYYEKLETQDTVETDLLELSLKHKRYGYRKLYQKLRQQNIVVNHKKVYRLYKKHNLALRIKLRKKLKVEKRPLSVPTMPQQVYALDFVHDRLANGRKIRILNIIDEFNSKAVSMYVDLRINSRKVIDVLNQLKAANKLPVKIRSDNGREFRSHNIAKWCTENNVQWEFIQPGKPMQNGYCERFNGTFRHELLNVYEFNTLAEAKLRVKLWMDEYNNERPHNRLNGLTPMQYEMWYMESV
jgi:putative transposase